MRSPAIRDPRRDRASTVDLSHDDVDAGVDRDDIGEQMSFDHLGNRGEIDERRRADPPAYGLRRTVRYHIVPFLALRAFHSDVRLANRWTRAFHHDLEVMDHGLHLARRLGFWR